MTIGRPNATMVDRHRSRGVTSIFEIPLSIVKCKSVIVDQSIYEYK